MPIKIFSKKSLKLSLRTIFSHTHSSSPQLQLFLRQLPFKMDEATSSDNWSDYVPPVGRHSISLAAHFCNLLTPNCTRRVVEDRFSPLGVFRPNHSLWYQGLVQYSQLLKGNTHYKLWRLSRRASSCSWVCTDRNGRIAAWASWNTVHPGTDWVPVENPSVETLECFVGLSGFESGDPGRVVIDFGVAGAVLM